MCEIVWHRHYNERAEAYFIREYLDYSDDLKNILKRS